jgi:hypothetical protein
LLTGGYQRTRNQLVKSLGRVVTLFVDAAQGSLVSEVTERI